MRFRFAASCAFAAFAAPAIAQSADPDAGGSFDLGQIVVRADLAGDMTIGSETVDRRAIEAFNRNTLDDAANLLPGVTVSSSGGSRNERLLFVRGFNRFQAPLSMDGIRVYLPADNRLDYGRFLTPDVAQIQVAKGYASVLDGPGAMGGAVNLVTRKPTREIEFEARGAMDLDRGADYAGHNLFALLGTWQGSWYAQASYARNEQDHWDLPGSFAPTASEDGGERDFSRTEDWRANVKVGFVPNATDEYSLSYTRQEGSKNAPLSTVDPVNIQRNWTWPWWNLESIYFLSTTALTDDVTLKTRAYRNTFDNLLSAYDDATQTTQTRGRAFNSYYDDEAWGGSAELAIATNESDRLAFALHFRSDQHVEFQQGFPSGDTEPPQYNEEDTWSVAAEYRALLAPAITLTAGASYDWRNLKRAEEFGEVPGADDDVLFDYPISDADAWNAQTRIEWNAGAGSRIFASVSSRARFPTVFERFSSRFGGATSNPDLQAERATNFELGGARDFGAVRAEGAVFYSRLSNAIVDFPFIFDGQAVTQSRNVGSGNYYGLELSLDAQVGPALTAGANYSYIHRDLNDPGDPAIRPVGVPSHKALIFAEWTPVPSLHVLPSVEIVSSRWTEDTAGTRYFRTGSYVDASLRVDYDISDAFTIGAGVRNAFDDLHYLTDGFPSPGRRFYLVARVRG